MSCNQLPCKIGKSEIVEALSILFSKGILELPDNELNISVPSGYENYLARKVKIRDKTIKLYSDKPVIPAVRFIAIKSEEEGLIKIYFSASEAGYKYKGEILFKCINDRLIYNNIHYISEIS